MGFIPLEEPLKRLVAQAGNRVYSDHYHATQLEFDLAKPKISPALRQVRFDRAEPASLRIATLSQASWSGLRKRSRVGNAQCHSYNNIVIRSIIGRFF